MDVTKSIFTVAPSAYPLGGVQTWLDYLIEGLRGTGWRPSLGLVSGTHHRIDEYLQVHPTHNAVSIAAPSGTRQCRTEAIRDCLLAERPDIVLGVNVADLYHGAALARQAGTRAKIVATLHGFGADFVEDMRTYKSLIDAVAVTNRLTGAIVKHLCGFSAERVFYCPYGVVANNAPPRRATHSKTLRLGYVGRFDEAQKRVSDLVPILQRLCEGGTPVELLLAGDGPEKATVMVAFERAGLMDHVEDLGVVAAEDCVELVYRRIDALLVTSSWETGPIVAWEAMSEGVVLVTSDYQGRKCEGSLVDGENCLVFPVGDAEAAAAEISRLSDIGLRYRLAEAGRALVLERYTREASVVTWDAALRRVLELPDLPPAEVPPIPRLGRLDRMFGVEWGEKVRRTLGIRFEHRSPGGEWPHSYGGANADDEAFWHLAAELDRPFAKPAAIGLTVE